MVKIMYEVVYKLKDMKTGNVALLGLRKVVEAESETNAIAELRKSTQIADIEVVSIETWK
jgi:hypothetical protein